MSTIREIGAGHYPEDERVIATWLEEHKTESPIRIQHGPIQGIILPGESVIVPESIGTMLRDESGYAILITPVASEEAEGEAEQPDDDAELEEAVTNVELQAKAKTLIGQSVEKLKADLDGASLELLRAALVAEEGEGPAKARVSAIAAIEAAIDAHPDQIAALAAAAGDPPSNEQTS